MGLSTSSFSGGWHMYIYFYPGMHNFSISLLYNFTPPLLRDSQPGIISQINPFHPTGPFMVPKLIIICLINLCILYAKKCCSD